jgi:hypothetical protein
VRVATAPPPRVPGDTRTGYGLDGVTQGGPASSIGHGRNSVREIADPDTQTRRSTAPHRDATQSSAASNRRISRTRAAVRRWTTNGSCTSPSDPRLGPIEAQQEVDLDGFGLALELEGPEGLGVCVG